MNIREYMQLALLTYVPPLEPLSSGFIGEAGEINDLYKKSHRKMIAQEQWAEEIADAGWYPAVWCHVHNVDFEALYQDALAIRFEKNTTFRTLIRSMEKYACELDEAEEFGWSFSRQIYMVTCYVACWERIRRHMGFTCEELWDANVKKLHEDRYAHLFEKSAE